jgi:hypothetical protein
VSIFDLPNDKKLLEVFPLGTPFMMYEAAYEGLSQTSYGPRPQATVTCGPPDRSGAPEKFRVWGTLAEQAQGLETGDLPCLVRVVKQGNRSVWEPITADDQPLPF